jgi:hypothetical protein
LAILELIELLGAWDPITYAHRKYVELRLRYLERLPLGTPYPAVAERVVEITRSAEMAEMRAKVTAAGNTQFGVWREGAHDDLVLAVALACWGARKMYPHGPYGDAAYWKRTAQGDWERGIKDWAKGRVV